MFRWGSNAWTIYFESNAIHWLSYLGPSRKTYVCLTLLIEKFVTQPRWRCWQFCLSAHRHIHHATPPIKHLPSHTSNLNSLFCHSFNKKVNICQQQKSNETQVAQNAQHIFIVWQWFVNIISSAVQIFKKTLATTILTVNVLHKCTTNFFVFRSQRSEKTEFFASK